LVHAPLKITIPIIKENILTKKHIIVKYSKKEKTFVNKIIKVIKDIDMSNLSNVISLESVVCSFTWSLEIIWEKIQKSSISPTTQKVGGMQIVAGIFRSIGLPRVLRIGSNLRK